MLLLGLDFESGAEFGGEVENNFITEAGWAIFDTELKQPVVIENTLVDPVREIVPDAVQYTGITTKMARTWGLPEDYVLNRLHKNIQAVDFVVAHNGTGFDKPLLEARFKANGLTMPGTPWIDTLTDVPYPANCMSKNLTYLAGFHGLLNCFPHRAVTDVLTMLKVLEQYNLDEVIDISKSPVITVQAQVSYHDRQKAKDARFFWDGDNKRWLKEIKACFYETEKSNWDFNHIILKES